MIISAGEPQSFHGVKWVEKEICLDPLNVYQFPCAVSSRVYWYATLSVGDYDVCWLGHWI